MQRLNSPIKLLRVPIRVVVIHGKKIYLLNIIKYLLSYLFLNLGLTEGVTCENSIDLSPSNPFLESQYKHEECDMALQVLQVCILKFNLNKTCNK